MASPDYSARRAAFRKLHESGCFVIPNPWDIGTARYLRSLGFLALATTSSGFSFSQGLPDADGREGTGEDGLRIGTARILTMSSDGTATSGTLYIRGRRGQYAVRVLGATGRTRMLQYDTGSRSWIDR